MFESSLDCGPRSEMWAALQGGNKPTNQAASNGHTIDWLARIRSELCLVCSAGVSPPPSAALHLCDTDISNIFYLIFIIFY